MKINKYLALLLIFLVFLLLGNLIFLLASYLTGISLEALSFKVSTQDSNKIILIKILIGISHFFGFVLTSIVYIHWYKKLDVQSFLQIKKGTEIHIFLVTLGILILSYPLIGFTTQMGDWITLPEWAKTLDESSIEQLKSLLKMDGPFDLILNLLVIAILPGLGEEFLFRGIIQKEFQTSFKSYHKAIWLSAFIFSAFHLQIEGFLPKMILGLLFGYIYYYTKNLWYPILLHAFNNGMQVFAVYLAGEAFHDINVDDDSSIHWAIAFSSFIGLMAVWHYYENKDKDKIQENK